MEDERKLLLKIINLWWVDYYMNDDFPDSAFTRFHQQLRGIFAGTPIKFKYQIQEDTWILKPKEDEEN